MIPIRWTFAAIAAVLVGCAQAPPSARSTAPVSQDERMAWWREARFGMFIHWGLYAIPAGRWGERDSHGEWIRTTAQIPRETYAGLQPQWNPTAFDADAWARMAADAGMKYLVITSKHHDGFCLFDSAETEWDVMNTPHGRDILAALSEACARHGVEFCTYHSIMDWHHPDYLPRRGWETDRTSAGADFDRFDSYLHAQVREVVENYDPAVMWFDGEWESTWSHQRGLRLFDLCRELSPSMIVNNRVDVFRGGMEGFSTSDEAVGDFETPEQEIPATGLPDVDWESCMTMNRHWGWNAADTQWKSSETLIHNLIDIASKGGNYLLNVGPRADGTFPPEAVERLREIGTWMDRFGDAVYGTTASIFQELPWEGRCTVRATPAGPTRLYLHVFAPPSSGELELPGLATDVVAAQVVGGGARLTARETSSGWAVAFPADAMADPIATVVEVTLDGNAVVHRSPTIECASEAFVTAARATLRSPGPGLVVRYTTDGTAPTPTSRAAGDQPLTIDRPCTLRARCFHEGQPVAEEVSRTFHKVKPRTCVAVDDPVPGLLRSDTDATWQAIPTDRAAAFSGSNTPAPAIALPADKRNRERIARRYRGLIRVPRTELVHFALTSDDGSTLWLHDELVVDNDGLHGAQEKRGAIALEKGLHPIEVIWFNNTGGAELQLQWSLDGMSFTPIPASTYVRQR